MEISGLSNAYLSQQATRLASQDQQTEGFQAALNAAVAKGDDAELKNACQEFEAYFIQYMFREMRKTVDTSGSFMQKSQTEEVFQDMLDEEYSKSVVKNGNGIGLADMMYKQMKRNGL